MPARHSPNVGAEDGAKIASLRTDSTTRVLPGEHLIDDRAATPPGGDVKNVSCAVSSSARMGRWAREWPGGRIRVMSLADEGTMLRPAGRPVLQCVGFRLPSAATVTLLLQVGQNVTPPPAGPSANSGRDNSVHVVTVTS